MNYFEFYTIPETFSIDKKVLRKAYLYKSREVHPDIIGSDASKEQDLTQDLASFNNEAYTVLNDDISTIKYILQLHNIAIDAKNASLPSDFLMDMMDLNEAIEERLESNLSELKDKVDQLQQSVEDQYLPPLNTYTSSMNQAHKIEVLNQARDYYLKMNYIKRLRENLEGSRSL